MRSSIELHSRQRKPSCSPLNARNAHPQTLAYDDNGRVVIDYAHLPSKADTTDTHDPGATTEAMHNCLHYAYCGQCPQVCAPSPRLLLVQKHVRFQIANNVEGTALLAHEWGLRTLSDLAISLCERQFDTVAARLRETGRVADNCLPDRCWSRLLALSKLAFADNNDRLWSFVVTRVHSCEQSFSTSTPVRLIDECDSARVTPAQRTAQQILAELRRRMARHKTLYDASKKPKDARSPLAR